MSERNQDGQKDSASAPPTSSSTLECPRCGDPMPFNQRISLLEGLRNSPQFDALPVQTIEFDLYLCKSCGRAEFFH